MADIRPATDEDIARLKELLAVDHHEMFPLKTEKVRSLLARVEQEQQKVADWNAAYLEVLQEKWLR